MKNLFFILLLTLSFFARAQPLPYTVANAHSHNDYEQKTPFWTAYNAGFGSIEADIFLIDSVLFVAHDSGELQRKIKLENEYLEPLLKCLNKNAGYPFGDQRKKLQILVDIKTDSIHTLDVLIQLLKKYPPLIQSKSLTWVITGNRPDEALFTGYPGFIFFDGDLKRTYTNTALSRISLMSNNFKNYSLWNGENQLPEKDYSILKSAVELSHGLNKPVRFWNAPDQANAWQWLMLLQVDYVNTDHIGSLADFMKKQPAIKKFRY